MADGMSVSWSGLERLDAALDHLGTGLDRAAALIVGKSSALLIAKAQSNFEGAHAKGQPHVGGNKPNVVTGYLRRSITAEGIIRHGVGEFGTHVGPTAIYGRRIELGYNGTAAYPYFQPAVEELRPEFEAIAAETWRHISSL